MAAAPTLSAAVLGAAEGVLISTKKRAPSYQGCESAEINISASPKRPSDWKYH